MSTRSLRVCLDARIPDGTHGGVQQVILGLAHGLSSLPSGPEEYLFLVTPGQWDWLRPHLVGPCRPLEAKGRAPTAWRRALGVFRRSGGAPESDGTVERAGADVVHLTLQDGFRTSLPTIYMPYDLQHVHLPGFFSAAELAARQAVYPDLCRRAASVVAISRWGKEDLVRTYGLEPGKVQAIHLAPAVDAYPPLTAAEVEAARRRLGLPATFAFYPAQAWPHKNHRALLEALAMLRRDDRLQVPLVLTGKENRFFPELRARIAELGLGDQVSSMGFLPPGDLRAVYEASRLVVFPSMFEGFGMPVLEAFRLGVPVAASSSTSLPEVAGGAARLFDPRDPRDVAEAVKEAWSDPALREELSRRGRSRAATFTWSRTASAFRSLYRKVAGRPLDDRDRAALADAA